MSRLLFQVLFIDQCLGSSEALGEDSAPVASSELFDWANKEELVVALSTASRVSLMQPGKVTSM